MARLFRGHPRRRGAHAGDRRALPLLAGRAALRISRRTDPARPDAGRASRRPDLARRRASAIRTAFPTRCAQTIEQGTGADRAAGLRALLPDRPRHRALRARQRTSSARGAARRPIRRSATASASPRSIPTEIDLLFERFVSAERQRAARHRRRFRARAARGGDPVHLRALRPRPRRHRRHGDPLPPADGDPRGRQGAGPVART